MDQHIEVPAVWASIARLLAFADEMSQCMALTADQSYLLRLVIEEIATNIVKYGYAESDPGLIRIRCRCDDGVMQLNIQDHGRPFDPRDHPPPDLSSNDPAERELGGLGVFFVREFADAIDYHHDPDSGWNSLRIEKGPS
jgi:anti-sigma regulatory factor (Ser/Thr protein kinase)